MTPSGPALPESHIRSGGSLPIKEQSTAGSNRGGEPRTHQPGTARQQRLISQVIAIPGERAQIKARLPAFTPALQFAWQFKPSIKTRGIQIQLELFYGGANSDDATRARVRDQLLAIVQQLVATQQISPAVGRHATTYINKKHDARPADLQFSASEEGGAFWAAGTNLRDTQIRSKNRAIFTLPETLDGDLRHRLDRDYQRQFFAAEPPCIYTGPQATVQVALRRAETGDEVVAAKVFNTLAAARKEHRIVNQLRPGPHLSPLLETAEIGSRAYLFMELAVADGLHVQHQIAAIGDAETRNRAKRTLALQYVRAVAALHQQQPAIRHLDIKPENFLLAPDGAVRISDFGFATTNDRFPPSRGGTFVSWGTPRFVDPQNGDPNATTVAADQYSLGATLYSLSEGGVPRHAREWVGYPDTANLAGQTLSEVAMKLMDSDRDARPTMDAVLELPYFKNHPDIYPNVEFFDLVMTPPPAGAASPARRQARLAAHLT
jgi:serine/threonine protein kinase